MSVKASWYDPEKTIILQEFPLAWTWDDFYAVVRETVEMERTVSHPVYVIGTQPPNGQTPTGNILSHYNSALKMHEPHMRYYIMATANRLNAVLGNILVKTSGMRLKVRLVVTFDDALRLVEKDKEKLSNEMSR